VLNLKSGIMEPPPQAQNSGLWMLVSAANRIGCGDAVRTSPASYD